MKTKRFTLMLILALVLAFSVTGQTTARFGATAPKVVSVTIASGGSLSTAANLAGCTLAKILVPTLQSSAVLTFQYSDTVEAAGYKELVDFFGTAVTYPASTGNVAIVLSPSDWYKMQYLRIRSGTASSAVTQTVTGGTTIKFVCGD